MPAAHRRALLALSLVALLGATPAVAAPDPEDAVVVDRLAGGDRFATAALIAAQLPQGADTVFLANGQDYAQGADAVAAGATAASGVFPDLVSGGPSGPAPVLLVRGIGIPEATRTALEELGPTQAVILGGPAVILPTVDEELLEMGIQPVRAFGRNRYGTAAVLAATFGPGVDTVFVASGEAIFHKPPVPPMMPDALAASARAGAEGAPVLLTRHGELPRETRAVLEALAPGSITIVGGENGVSRRVALELEAIAPVTRLKGSTRYETAAALFEEQGTGVPAYLASGEGFADSLSVSALAATQQAPLLLSRRYEVPPVTEQALLEAGPTSVHLVGGPTALDDAVLTGVRALLGP
ncbi:cell wall-binding repeat-containing protein [uncultured Serinicoccus sp.]|uniref:cell wall-binding repeat-containing protein n=1 Tax=uncultured Serinicoccus sp. TaxID=735514 RepID=UPI002628B1AE|nr:cell wall-binding repeat-containing protein [uncultured Serinicoccus sp.]